jgi:hypothetical protein
LPFSPAHAYVYTSWSRFSPVLLSIKPVTISYDSIWLDRQVRMQMAWCDWACAGETWIYS